MASIVVAGDTSGTVTLAAPAVSGTTTITLPTVSGGNFVVSDSNGNVGIGTSSPVNIAGYTIQTINNASNGGGVYLQSNGTTIGRILNTATDCFVGGVSASSGLVLQSGGVVRMNIDSSGNFGAVIPSGNTYYPAFWCRAWVNFNGTGTVAIRASGNVTSITDNGTGDYTVNLTTAMPDTNYCGVALPNDGTPGTNLVVGCENQSRTKSTSAFHVWTAYGGNGSNKTLYDVNTVNVAIFR